MKSRWSSANIGQEEVQKWPSFQDSNSDENEFRDKLWSCPFRFSQRNTITESLKLEQMSFGVSENDVQFNSPSSAVSSDRNLGSCEVMDEVLEQDEMEVDDFDEDELMSSYVIELDSCNRETVFESPNDVDEAIAWAKEKFQKHCSQTTSTQGLIKLNLLSFVLHLVFHYYQSTSSVCNHGWNNAEVLNEHQLSPQGTTDSSPSSLVYHYSSYEI